MHAIDDAIFHVVVTCAGIRIAYESCSRLPPCEVGRRRCSCRIARIATTFVSSMN